jgi:hypothetical protein
MTDYVKQLSIFDELEEDITGYVKTLSIAIGDNLIDEMPVDTGRARSNTFIFSANDSLSEIDPYRAYPVDSGPNKTEMSNRNAAKTNLRKSAESIKPFDSVFIVNNATSEDGDYYYAGDLDLGASRQTPAGMVDRSIVSGIMKANILWDLNIKVSE